MSQIPNMLESTIQKIREMVDVNSVIGEPISTPDGVTIIPVSKVSVGFGGGGSDFTKKTAAGDNPFGGGVGGGVKVTPICFLIVKDGNVRMMPVAEPASSTADRIVEMVPDTLDKLTAHKKRELAITFGELVYDGQWFSPLRKALSAFVTSTQEHVTGKVRLELYKGNLINAGVWSPYSLYREDIATFAAGGDYKQSDATGFISIYGLPTKVQAIVNSEKEGE